MTMTKQENERKRTKQTKIEQQAKDKHKTCKQINQNQFNQRHLIYFHQRRSSLQTVFALICLNDQ